VEHVHSKGLLFGIYGDRGWKTCAFRPGSRGHEQTHAQQFATWGVDYLKHDSCWASNDHETAFGEYAAMRDALNSTGRPILYSLCGWNAWYAEAGERLANSWRIAADCDEWANVYVAVRTNEALHPFAGPGHFNDPDMLLGSNPAAPAHLTPTQVQTQFSLWAVMAAPLLIGSSLLDMPPSDLETYLNDEVIAIDQDPLGKQGVVVWSNCPPITVRDNWWNSPWSMPHEVAVMWSQALAALAVVLVTSAFLLRRGGATGVCATGVYKLLVALASLAIIYIAVIWHFRPHVDPCQQVWARPLQHGGHAFCFVNFAPTAAEVSCDEECMLRAGVRGEVSVRDVVRHIDMDRAMTLHARLEGNGASALYRVVIDPVA